ncbi:hypothetical protein RAD15_25385 [Bradyrhizobium sp. 14AA]
MELRTPGKVREAPGIVRAFCVLDSNRMSVTCSYFKSLYWEAALPSSINLIVSAYVRLKNRRALEDMRELRRQLLAKQHSSSGIDQRHSQELVLEDLRVIEHGLELLRLPPGA